MSAITDFLLDRYDEEEALIRAVQPLQMTGYHGDALDIVSVYRHRQRSEDGAAYSVADHESTSLLRHLSPERLLADIEAKRRIVSRCDMVLQGREHGMFNEGQALDAADNVLSLVQPYSQHPDFYPAWRLS